MAIDKKDVRLGFYLALGFFLFGLMLAVLQYVLMKLRGKG